MLRVTVTLFVGSAVETAVRFTGAAVAEPVAPKLESAAGAVYVLGAPLAVCAGLKLPHLGPLQLTCQSTPMFWGSFATVAITGAVAKTSKGEGGSWVKSTWIELGVPKAGEPELAQPGIQSSASTIAGSRTAAGITRGEQQASRVVLGHIAREHPRRCDA